MSTDCLLNTGVCDLGHSGFIITEPPEQCPGEFTMLVLTGLGVGSGWYIGVGGEYGGRATGPGGVGVLTQHTIGVVHAGVIMLTFTGRTGDLLAPVFLDLLGTLSLANETDLDLLIGGLVLEGVWLRALR